MRIMADDMEEGCGVNRAKPNGYYWKQHINAGVQAEQRARQYLDKLTQMENTGSASRHLLQIALALGDVQQSLYGLLDIAARDE